MNSSVEVSDDSAQLNESLEELAKLVVRRKKVIKLKEFMIEEAVAGVKNIIGSQSKESIKMWEEYRRLLHEVKQKEKESVVEFEKIEGTSQREKDAFWAERAKNLGRIRELTREFLHADNKLKDMQAMQFKKISDDICNGVLVEKKRDMPEGLE